MKKKPARFAYLYDEDRWPSGFAGGYVTKDRRYAQKELMFTVNKLDNTVPYDEFVKTGKPYFATVFDVELNKNGELIKYRRIDEDASELGEGFKSEYGFDLVDRSPELLWELPNGEVCTFEFDVHIFCLTLNVPEMFRQRCITYYF